ncbi:MAG: ABC-F family ATP-binding cassette domain-containing protein [Candidatus Dependentiae bacterium]
MSQSLITLADVSITLPHRTLFSGLNATITSGDRIALIGRNGSGKTTLLKALCKEAPATSGTIKYYKETVVGFLPQTMRLDQNKTVWEVAIEAVADSLADLKKFEACNAGEISLEPEEYDDLLTRLSERNAFELGDHVTELLNHFELAGKKDDLVRTLSGGQQTVLGLVRLMATSPTVLLLDEPTNNLDTHHRQILYDFLADYKGALFIITHDTDFLRKWPRTIWSIDQEEVTQFDGAYEDFCQQQKELLQQKVTKKEDLQKEMARLKKAVEKEKVRAGAKVQQGRKKHADDKIARRAAQERGEKSTGKAKGDLLEQQEELSKEIKKLFIPKEILPNFTLNLESEKHTDISVHDASIGYGDAIVVKDFAIAAPFGARIYIRGRNGSGKSTMIKALLSNPEVQRDGHWLLPKAHQIGYLDQEYRIVEGHDTAVHAIKHCRPEWEERQIRAHLSTFLFRSNAEATTDTKKLSGGEKARLSLAMIAAQSPAVLLLDEITNNIDLETRTHCIQVLREYPGTIIAISHDEDFLDEIECDTGYELANGSCSIV